MDSASPMMVLKISAQFGEAVVAQYLDDGVVCPPVLRKRGYSINVD